jgi:hypothetical protein
MNEHLRIGTRFEAVPLGLKVAPKLLEIVDLAVDDDRNRAVLVRHRLGALLGALSAEVDDRQPAMAERTGAIGQVSVIVGSAMDHCVAHASHGVVVRRRLEVGCQHSRDAAHCVMLPSAAGARTTREAIGGSLPARCRDR